MKHESFDHVSDPELRAILTNEVAIGIEETSFACKATIEAWEHDTFASILTTRSHEARQKAIDTIHSEWGNGEDGDAAAVRACRMYWSN